ncbi:MAG: isoamylase early set domain-containing protein, partial [Verrucomicrobia bacterium]|nr:isoamylase early set domain-containing protein [Verrucomicrobiota bacterium]
MAPESYSLIAPNCYSAKRSVRFVNFYCPAPRAKRVCLVGDFNDWDPTDHPMNLKPTGTWTLALPLHHGHHRYYFLVDGKPTLDPKAQGTVRNERDEA